MSFNYKIIAWSLTAALGGFLFGFDTAVISGVEQKLQSIWGLTVFQHGLTVSMGLIGTVIGALAGGIPADRWGRKTTLLIIAVFYFAASLGSALTSDWSVFLFFRFIGGLGVGASSVTAPMYISEISPADKRGRMVALFQFNVVFGILTAYLSNYLIGHIVTGESAWRWMLGIQAVPSVFFMALIFIIPESPRWLILKRGKIREALGVLQSIDPQNAQQTLDSIQNNQNNGSGNYKSAAKASLFSGAYKRPILLAFLFALFNQLSGINAIIYYSPRIFEMTGLGADSALLSSAGIGLVNLISTLLGMSLIDKFGRRKLMLAGSVGLILTLALVSRAFFVHDFSGYTVPVLLFVYIAFFAFSQGAVIWVFISEIFPNEVRAGGQTLGSSTHWFMAAIVAFTFPYLAETFGGAATFLFFAVMMVLQLLFVIKLMPETKGTSLEQIEKTVFAH